MKPYYDEDVVTIYLGDCRAILPELPKFDLLLTDPPYGLKAARAEHYGGGVKRHLSGFGKGGHIPKRDYGDSDWDDAPADADALRLCIERAERQIIFGGNYFLLPPAKCWFVWDKLRGDTDYADAEMAWTNLPTTVRMFRFRWNGFLTDSKNDQDKRVHPTQKPVALMKWCVSRCKPVPQSVLDPFAGSGTTAVACKDAKIPCTLVDAEERYCEIAAKRLSQRVLDFEEAAR